MCNCHKRNVCIHKYGNVYFQIKTGVCITEGISVKICRIVAQGLINEIIEDI